MVSTRSADPLLLTVTERDGGQRLDLFLAERIDGVSRSALARMVREGAVSVNGKRPRKAGQPLEPGDVVVVRLEPLPLSPQKAQAADPLRILYEDEHLLAIDKPAGVAVHPGPGHLTNTLVERLLALGTPLSSIGGAERPGIVHRLDMETSGVMLVAKTDETHGVLSGRFAERTVRKAYLALLRGHMQPEEGVIDAPIARDPGNRQRMAVVTGGREARTGFSVVGDIDGHSLVIARPQTGRSHQIRVHFASMGHPVAGDTAYGRGGAPDGLTRMFLHALRLVFDHPITNELTVVESPLAADLEQTLRAIAGYDYEALMARVSEDA
jgi:23S rRNA pseudouridine1911/1915/1917 synthase